MKNLKGLLDVEGLQVVEEKMGVRSGEGVKVLGESGLGKERKPVVLIGMGNLCAFFVSRL